MDTTTQSHFLQRLSQTIPVLCRKIEKLNTENPAGIARPHEERAEHAALVVRKDVLDYLEEETYCKNLSPFEAALVEEEVYEVLWQCHKQRQHHRAASIPFGTETMDGLPADAVAHFASIGVSADDALRNTVTAFEGLLRKASNGFQVDSEVQGAPLSILDKFDAVVITNESRISGEELEYCTAQQALYVAMLGQHRQAFQTLQELKTSCDTFLSSVSEDNEYKSDGYTYKHYDCDYVELEKEEFAQKRIGKIHRLFISIIINYFTEKYGVGIEDPEFEVLTGIEKPDESSRPYRSFSRRREWTDEEIAEMDAEADAFKKAQDAYIDAIINAQLDYNTLLDHIFVELDGDTFAERAEQEIRQGSVDASHNDRGKNMR